MNGVLLIEPGMKMVEAVRERGLRPYVATTTPRRYIEPGLCGVFEVDTSDTNRVLAIGRLVRARYGLSAVIATSELFALSAAQIARKLELPGADPAMVSRCRDKAKQIATLEAVGLPIPNYRVVTGLIEAHLAVKDLGLPVVTKPVDGTGSRNVVLCRTQDEMIHAVEANWKVEPEAPVLIQEFVSGDEFSVEVFQGEPIAIVRKRLGPHPYFVEVGHDVPAVLAAESEQAIVDVARRAVASLELDWGANHVELRLTGPKKAVLLEVNPRLAGGNIPQLIQLAWGIDLVGAVVSLALGQPPLLKVTHERAAAIRFVVNEAEGLGREVLGIENAMQEEGVVEALCYYKPGIGLRLHHDHRDRIGHIMVQADDPITACAWADRAHARVLLV